MPGKGSTRGKGNGKGRGVWMMLIAWWMSVGMAAPVWAETTGGHAYLGGATRKLGRGLANVITAPLEMIRTPYFVSQRDGGVAEMTVGIVQGVGASVVRELAGIVEVATWLIPIPRDFRPLVQPEFVYAQGDWVP